MNAVLRTKQPKTLKGLNINNHALNTLHFGHIDTLEDLLANWPDIKQLRGMGPKTYNQIGRALVDAGYIPVFAEWIKASDWWEGCR